MIRSRSRAASTAPGSNRGSTTCLAPSIVPGTSMMFSSAAWYSGATCRNRSPARMPQAAIIVTPTHSTRWWSNSAPFGRPVVPEV